MVQDLSPPAPRGLNGLAAGSERLKCRGSKVHVALSPTAAAGRTGGGGGCKALQVKQPGPGVRSELADEITFC